MKKPKVFIHTNSKQILGAIVGRYTMKKNSRHPEAFDVEFITTQDYPYLNQRDGKKYLREGKRIVWKSDDLQSFTPLRFLPPQLMGYEGRAVVTDPDVFALKDIYDLLTLDLKGKALAARKIRPKDGRPHYWATSVMLMDCEKLKHWKWEQTIDKMFNAEIDYRDWMSLLLEDQSNILELPEEWNHYDVLNDKTILLHNTGRITQPWKTGLPIDFSFDKVKPPIQWGKDPKTWIKQIWKRINPPPTKPNPTVYRAHPDKNQERFFFQNLKEILEQGEITEDFIHSEVQKKHVRPDALEVIARL